MLVGVVCLCFQCNTGATLTHNDVSGDFIVKGEGGGHVSNTLYVPQKDSLLMNKRQTMRPQVITIFPEHSGVYFRPHVELSAQQTKTFVGQLQTHQSPAAPKRRRTIQKTRLNTAAALGRACYIHLRSLG